MVLHFDVAFAVDVVLDVTKGWRNVWLKRPAMQEKKWRNVWLNPKVFPLFVSFGIECFDTLPRVMKKPAESLDDQRSVLNQMVS